MTVSRPIRRVLLRIALSIQFLGVLLTLLESRGAALAPAVGSVTNAGTLSAVGSTKSGVGGFDGKPTFRLPQFEAGQPLRMVAYGDMRFTDPEVTKGTNPRVRRWLAEKVGSEHPQALMITGDMPFNGDQTADWEQYQLETASWKAGGFPVFPTIGNHEIFHDKVKGIANYLANYPLIEGHRWYSAVLGSVEVLSLDMTSPVTSSQADGHSEQAEWFVSQLEHVPGSVEFLFILYHVPLVADTQSQMMVGIPTRDAFVVRDLLEARIAKIHAKVVVFSGHIHNYERFERHGIQYIVTGGGGAVPYPILFRGSHDLYRDLGFPVYHYLTLEIADHQLKAVMWKVIDSEAAELNVEVKDRFTIKANPSTPLKPPKSVGRSKPASSKSGPVR